MALRPFLAIPQTPRLFFSPYDSLFPSHPANGNSHCCKRTPLFRIIQLRIIITIIIMMTTMTMIIIGKQQRELVISSVFCVLFRLGRNEYPKFIEIQIEVGSAAFQRNFSGRGSREISFCFHFENKILIKIYKYKNENININVLIKI